MPTFGEQSSEPNSDEALLKLALFVALRSPSAGAAIGNVRAAFERFPNDAFDLEIIDVFEEPERALRERVLVTPTLIARPSGRRVVGDLSDPKILDVYLQSLTF